MQTILLIDDDLAVIASLTLLLKQAGYRVLKATSPQEGLKILAKEPVGLVLQDMNFTPRQTSGEEGMALLAQVKAAHPRVPVVLMTAWGTIAMAVAGVQAGAADFITKPWTNQQLLQTVRTTFGLAAVDQPNVLNRHELDQRYDLQHIIGQSPKLLRVLEIIGRVAPTEAPILITGESGTGKELIAEAVHRNSRRRDKELVRVNLGSVPASLFESELFGHVKGAFTDAKFDRKGRFETADGGTLFLDEIGDLDFGCQVKMLRVLQDRVFEPVGSSKSRTADVRIVSATNRNLSEMIAKGTFREDLLYRLNLIAVHLPPLRERKEDIPLIARHFLDYAAKVYRREKMHIAEPALRWLQQQKFPGNIRELKHLIERSVILSPSSTLDVEDFLAGIRMEQSTAELSPADEPIPPLGAMSIEDMEKAMILKALEQHQGNLTKVAEALGISRFALYRRLEKHQIRTNPPA